MNREIKFRALPKDNDKKFWVTFIPWEFKGYDNLNLETICQYTGIKDKNGNEIYEGDIVLVWLPGMTQEMRAEQEILYIRGCFGFGDYPINIVDLSRIEVIGNRYENPELCEEIENGK